MKPFFRVILAMCALLLTWTAVAAEAEEEKEKDPFLVAMTLLLKESSEEPEGLETIRDAAENGSADAQCQLGLLYVFGFRGTPVNRTEAVRWFRQAAGRGRPDAQYCLACCLEYGRGVRKDEGKAAELYRKSAEQGFAPAQYRYGLCLQQGTGVLQDNSEAVKWYRKAAERGIAGAQVSLGLCYENGAGVKKDGNLARKWFHSAAARGDEEGMENLLRMQHETVCIIFHHPSRKLACDFCGKVVDPMYSVDDYKGDDFHLCSDCRTLPYCQYCRAPAVMDDGDDRMCRGCSESAVTEQEEAETILEEVRESLLEQFRMSTRHRIVCELGTRSELGLRREDDPQKMSIYESEKIDEDNTRYTIRILTNLPQDIFRIAAAQALAQDWLEETVPLVMADPDVRDGFSLYVARMLYRQERLRRTKKWVKRLEEDGRYEAVSKMLRNQTAVKEWRQAFKHEYKEEEPNIKMPVRQKPDDAAAERRAKTIKENDSRKANREKMKQDRAVPGGKGLPDTPGLPPQPGNHENDLINTQGLLKNGLKRGSK